MTGRPFDDIRNLVSTMPSPDAPAIDGVRGIMSANWDILRPLGKAAGYLEWLAGWQGRAPSIDRPLIAVFAGTHCVSSQVFDEDQVSLSLIHISEPTRPY